MSVKCPSSFHVKTSNEVSLTSVEGILRNCRNCTTDGRSKRRVYAAPLDCIINKALRVIVIAFMVVTKTKRSTKYKKFLSSSVLTGP